MSKVDPIERATQHKVIKLFTEELGYTYLGDWQDRQNKEMRYWYSTFLAIQPSQ